MDPCREMQGRAPRARVLRREAGAGIGHAGSPVVEHLRKGRRGQALEPFAVRQGQGHAAAPHLGEEAAAAVVVQALRDALVLSGRIVGGKVEVLAPGGGARGGHQPVAALRVHRAQRKAQPGVAVAAQFGADLRALGLPAFARDDVEHAEKGIRAINGRTRAGHEFHALDQVDVDGEIRAHRRLVVQVVVEPHAIDQQQHPGVVVPGRGKAAHAQVVVGPVVGHIQSAHAGQNLGQVAVVEGADVLGGHDADRGRGLECALEVAARGAHLHLHQLLQRQLGDIGLGMRPGCQADGHADPEGKPNASCT